MPPNATTSATAFRPSSGNNSPPGFMCTTHLTATELRQLLADRKLSAEELAREFLDRIEQSEPQVGTFLWRDPQHTLDAARAADRARADGAPLGLLAGLPFAVKDVLCSQGLADHAVPRGCWQNFRPPYDATVVQRLQTGGRRAAGQDEHGRVRHGRLDGELGLRRHAQSLGPVAGPGRLQRRSGRLRGGAHGPAVGRHRHGRLDPPAGRLLRRGGTEADLRARQPLRAGGLCQQPGSGRPAGPHGRGRGAAAGSARRPRSARFDLGRACPCRATRRRSRQPLDRTAARACVREHFGDGLDAEVEAAVREAIGVYESLGAEVQEVSLPHSKYAIATYYIIAPSEASSNLARYDGVHYGYRTDETADAAPSWSTSEIGWKPPATRRRSTSSTARWSACTAGPGPKGSAPK